VRAPGGPRRSLSAQRAGGGIRKSGMPALATQLGRALDVAGEGENHLERYTHGIHSYPARMHPLTARRALVALGAGPGKVVLDPFCGSGTVLVEGMLTGATCIGVDANPLAILLARARVFRDGPQTRRHLVDAAQRIAGITLAAGKAARRAGYEPPDLRRVHADDSAEAAREAALEGWFSTHVRRELETLAQGIDAERPGPLRDVLAALLSSIVVKMSRRTSDTRGETTPRKLGRGMAARLFAERAEKLAMGLAALDADAPAVGRAEVHLGDARELRLADASVHLVVTSPPYAGTYDYLEHHRLRAAFLGLPIAEFQKRELGSRRSFGASPGTVDTALMQWDVDLSRVLVEIRRVLVPGGRAAFLVGDSLAGRGRVAVAIAADHLLADVATRAGLRFVAAAAQSRPLLGSLEHDRFAGKGKHEHLMVFEKER
jgi:SAM-dependent methyltransferase